MIIQDAIGQVLNEGDYVYFYDMVGVVKWVYEGSKITPPTVGIQHVFTSNAVDSASPHRVVKLTEAQVLTYQLSRK